MRAWTLPVGAGVGTALGAGVGVALGDIAIGAGIGTALGAGVGAVFMRIDSSSDASKAPERSDSSS